MNTTKNTRVLYARQCQITGNLFNQGYCIGDGAYYVEKEEHAAQYVRDFCLDEVVMHSDLSIEDLAKLSDSDLLEHSFDCEQLYYTEWCEQDIWNIDLIKAYYVMQSQGFHPTINLEEDSIYLSAWNETLQDTIECKVTAEEVTSRASEFEA